MKFVETNILDDFSNSFWTNAEKFQSRYYPYNTRRRWLRNNVHLLCLYPKLTSKLYFRTLNENSTMMAVPLNSFSILNFLVSTTVTLMIFRELTQLSTIRTCSYCNTHCIAVFNFALEIRFSFQAFRNWVMILCDWRRLRQSTASLAPAQVILPGHLHHVQATRWLLGGTSTFAKLRGQSTRSPTRSPGGDADLGDSAEGRQGRAQGWGPVVFDRMYAINQSILIRYLGAETAGNKYLIVAARINLRICT